MLESATCPICGSNHADSLWSVTSAEAAQHFVLEEKHQARHLALAVEIERLWSQKSASTHRCRDCGFGYAWPYVAGGARFYELAYDHNEYPTWKWEFQVTLEAITPRLSPTFRLLEIGAGSGSFISAVLKNGAEPANLFCTEYSPHGKERITRLGVKCLAVDIRDSQVGLTPGEFDAICMFQVLEHLDRLDELFAVLGRLLKNDGTLFIAVPNSRRINFNERNGALLDMPPNHVGRWNRKCFELIGKKHGFCLDEHRTEPFRLGSALKELSYYRFLRAAQRRGSVANRIHAIKSRPLRKLVEIFSVGLGSLSALPKVMSMKPEMGVSQWVHFTKDR